MQMNNPGMPLFQLLPMSSPSVDQHQPPTTVMEKLLNSENSSTSNFISQGVANKSSSSLLAEDRLVVGAHQFSTEPGSSTNTATSSSSNPFKGNSAGCASSKRKMDFGSGNISLNSNSANCSGISSISGNNSNGSGSFAAQLLKRPTLMSHDYENIIDDDDAAPNQLLYDYSSCDAW